ncbi:MAG: hypothetical protein WCG42_00240 [Parachlamydiaceae bacterium]
MTVNAIFDRTINDVQSLSEKRGAFLAPRLGAVVVTSTEALVVAGKVLFTAPKELVGSVVGLGARVISVISGSEAVKKFADSMPTLSDFIKTVVKTVGYAMGTVFSATLGVLSPSANYRLHCSLGLATHLYVAKIENYVVYAQQVEQELKDVFETVHSDVQEVATVAAKTAEVIAEEVVHAAEKEVAVIKEKVVAEEEVDYSGLSTLFEEQPKIVPETHVQSENVETTVVDEAVEETIEDNISEEGEEEVVSEEEIDYSYLSTLFEEQPKIVPETRVQWGKKKIVAFGQGSVNVLGYAKDGVSNACVVAGQKTSDVYNASKRVLARATPYRTPVAVGTLAVAGYYAGVHTSLAGYVPEDVKNRMSEAFASATEYLSSISLPSISLPWNAGDTTAAV